MEGATEAHLNYFSSSSVVLSQTFPRDTNLSWHYSETVKASRRLISPVQIWGNTLKTTKINQAGEKINAGKTYIRSNPTFFFYV